MDPATLALFCLASAGLSIIVTKSFIFKPLRDRIDIGDDLRIEITKGYLPSRKERIRMKLHKWITCPLCFGFYSGGIVYFMMFSQYGYFTCLCFASSIVSMVAYSVLYR
jgi:hypothetical protein